MQNDGIIAKGINKLANAIMTHTTRVENAKGMALEHIAIILYCTAHMLMYLVHEPWFDEALAWLIARDSSIYEIFFTTPHYEGHPALWHLILVAFAKLGTPYELSLSLVSLLFSGLAVGLFIYKAPFRRTIRLTMPFTYYLFYQYGVISRPYCMMMLAFVIMAMTFKNRNEKPGRFVLSLWFLCISSAYGIVIAGGICIAWLMEMFIMVCQKSKNKNTDDGEHRGAIRIFIEDNLFERGKFFWLLGLLIYVIFILWRIMPAENAYASIRATKAVTDNGLLIRLLYTLFAALSDLFITNVFYTSGTLRNADIYFGEMVAAVLIGIVILVALIVWAKRINSKRENFIITMLYLCIPYLFYTVFGALVYLYYHHIGISLLVIGFWLWTAMEYKGEQKRDAIVQKENSNSFLTNLRVLVAALIVIIPIIWSLASCVSDAFRSYGSGREQYKYLEENGLDEGYNILADYNRVFKEEEVPDDYTEYDPIFSQQGVDITPYLKNSIIINSPKLIGKNYSYQHEIPDKVNTEDVFQHLENMGMPDIIIGKPDITYIDYSDYMLVYKDTFGNIKKGFALSDTNTYIYVRKPLAEEKGLKEVKK